MRTRRDYAGTLLLLLLVTSVGCSVEFASGLRHADHADDADVQEHWSPGCEALDVGKALCIVGGVILANTFRRERGRTPAS